ncbi:MAG TPA: tetratricopeptide repeat protein [Rhodanobacteraceae bacterium]|nr:tetratricopeptide repeat protein [Rhodanobacteraceae bacterium]
MKAWHWLLVGIAGWLLIGGLFWLATKNIRQFVAANAKRAAVERAESAAPLPKGRSFTRVETNTFLDAAERAEKIADPLQRCLAYPDPPDSHWERDEVVAYCKYRLQPIITYAQVRQLVQSGRAHELDGMFDAALHAQMSDPDARGRLDRIFITDFAKASFDIRTTLDNWKRQSPNSAFAYAASGYEYERMAFDARGEKYLSETPQSAIDAMDRLARLADADLKHALALNPKITPAYSAMISLGGMTFGENYGLDAAKRGLAEAPGDLYIYDRWMWLEQPNWYGSLEAMSAIAADAQKRAKRDPLLRLLVSGPDSYRIQKCKCSDAVQLSAYAAVLDQLGSVQDLSDAAYTAKDAGNPQAMTIYFSEALRFDPDLRDVRIERIYDLVEFDRIPWATDEADRLLAQSPGDEYAIKARGWAYLIGNDLPHAQADFETASRLNPDDGWVLGQLSGIYMQTKQWDKAWDIADKLIAKAPQDPGGWTLRAAIQMQQPRPGLKETTDYLESHFFTDKKNLRFNAYIAHLRTVLQRQASAPTNAAHG